MLRFAPVLRRLAQQRSVQAALLPPLLRTAQKRALPACPALQLRTFSAQEASAASVLHSRMRELNRNGKHHEAMYLYDNMHVDKNTGSKIEYRRAQRALATQARSSRGYSAPGAEEGMPAEQVQVAARDVVEQVLEGLQSQPIHVINRTSFRQSFTSAMTRGIGLLLIGGMLLMMLRNMFGGGDRSLGAGGGGGLKSILFDNVGGEGTRPDVHFSDVLGIDEVKEELEEIVKFLKDPGTYHDMGANMPSGVLLHGPPGTGKTMLAKAVSGEAGVPFFFVSGSEFDEVFVGLGAKRIRNIFETAKKNAPSIIFIDEIDAVGYSRKKAALRGYNDHTLNQLLACMDGFERKSGVIVIAATNLVENLDQALLRPGRFDKKIAVHPPDLKGRKQIIELYLDRVKHGKIDIEAIAKSTMGATGADLANMVNVAAIKAVNQNKRQGVDQALLEQALDDVLLGPERKSTVITEEARKSTAYHEGGHALVSELLGDKANPVRKITIVPRGQSLGATLYGLKDERNEVSRNVEQLKAQLAIAMGGHAAEELIYGADKVSTGAASDLRQAKSIAYSMVTKYGMSDRVGKVFIDDDSNISPAMAQVIDEEVKKLLDIALDLLKQNRSQLERLVAALLKYETISGAEMKLVLRGKRIKR